jgi:hypothetical protein
VKATVAADRARRGGFLPLLALGALFVAARFAAGTLDAGFGLVPEGPGTRDFVQYWAAHRALDSGRNAYDGDVIFAIEETIGPRKDRTILMWNPPWTALLLEPVVTLPFPASALLWLVTSMLMLAGIAVLLPGALGRSSPHLVVTALAVACFYPVAQCLVWGQLSVFLAFFLVLFLHFERRGELFAAGLALVPLTCKPHLFFLLGVPGLLWLGGLSAARRRAFLAGSVGGMATLVALTTLRWPEALAWWGASLSSAPTGPGAVAMESWKTSTLATLVRSLLEAATGVAPRWPMWALPLLGLAGTVVWFARSRREIVWAETAPPLLALSLTFGSYGWTYDQTLLLPLQVGLVCDAAAARDRRAAARVFGAVILVQAAALAVGARPGAAHADFLWLPWAMLAAWAFGRRELGLRAPVSADARSTDTPGAGTGDAVAATSTGEGVVGDRR